VVNLPGSPRACSEGFAVLAPVAEHAVRLLRAEPTSHAPSSPPPAGS
jgi:molybdopterin biosynthesis enzyme MoaB